MKKTFNGDETPMREAREACGATTDTETIRPGLEALVRHEASKGERVHGFGARPGAG
jgi:hypothetical protein